ncbi:DUF2268 domain-containing putative Zn-dependent protease [Nonomuraea sp. NPDC050310]|uniref:DUF2268 domain-containing protein n=1 Tax=Nonomuraea sp. NPDC050310 TaxID=3154935 RepID=UPI0033D6D6CE
MKLHVHDTLTTMAALLERPLEERPGLLREMLAPMAGALPPGDPVELVQQGGGLRVDADDPRYAEAVRDLAAAGLLEQIEERLHAALAHLRREVPDLVAPDDLQVMFVLGNPDDEYLMRTTGGYYGMGGAPGWLYLLAWPTEDNIGRIAHCAVHEFHHQVRYRNVEWNPVTVTVGEHVVAEGLAEAFVRELSGEAAMGPWSGMVTGAEFDRARELIMADIGLQGMRHTPGYVLGDSAAVRFGGQARGIPDMAGYAVGLDLVDRFLAATGLSAARATVLPGSEIISRADAAR